MKKEGITIVNLELETGDVVVTRNDNVYLVVGDKLIGNRGYIQKYHYDENLKYNGYGGKYFNIIEIYNIENEWGDGFSGTLEKENLEKIFQDCLVWKREE